LLLFAPARREAKKAIGLDFLALREEEEEILDDVIVVVVVVAADDAIIIDQ
jgi:hypothetical protein